MAALILTHGAGSDRNAPLLIGLDAVLTASGLDVIRMDLPFREARRHGPPFPGEAARDRAALYEAVTVQRARVDRVFLGGHSYGGRQATMLAAENPGLVDALLLLSYPLHPPRKPGEKRTKHFPALRTPAFFVHGTRDPFGSVEEMREAMALIPGPVHLLEWEGAGHDLRTKRRESADELAAVVTREFLAFAG